MTTPLSRGALGLQYERAQRFDVTCGLVNLAEQRLAGVDLQRHAK